MVHRHKFLWSLSLLVCAVMAAPSLQASPVYVELGQDSVLARSGQTLSLDLDANGTVDFILSRDSIGGGVFLRIAAPTPLLLTNKIAVTGNLNLLGTDEVLGLNAAATVSNALSLRALLAIGAVIAQPSSAGSNLLEGRGDVYLGVSFNGSGGTHYGWIRVSVNAAGDTLRVSGWAFENSAGASITTGDPSQILVQQIGVHGAGGVNVIATNGGTLQMEAEITPANAANKNITWSVNDTTVASIDAGGLLHAQGNGTATVTGTATDGSGVSGSTTVVVSNQQPIVQVSQIMVHSVTGETGIATPAGTLAMVADVQPADASDKMVIWSVDNTSMATIDAGGLLHAMSDGTVTVKATATDGSGISGSATITMTNQASIVHISQIMVHSATGETGIATPGGTLTMVADIQPADASNKMVDWRVDNATMATIDAGGILHAMGNGTVTVTASATDGSGVSGSATITVTNQNPIVQVSRITVRSATGATGITAPGGTLMMVAEVEPATATNPGVTWSVDNGAAAMIDPLGVLTARGDGQVMVTATALDGSNVHGAAVISISGQAPAAVAGFTATSDNAPRVQLRGNLLTVELPEEITEPLSVGIYDVIGRGMAHYESDGAVRMLAIDCSALPSGAYLISGQRRGGIAFTERIVLAR